MKPITLIVKGLEDYSEKQWRVMFGGAGSIWLNKADWPQPPALGDQFTLLPPGVDMFRVPNEHSQVTYEQLDTPATVAERVVDAVEARQGP